MVDTEPLVRIRDLRYRYPGADHDVLRIPFLDVSGAGLIAVTGPSGAGKSTLVEILAGTLRGTYSGSVQVLGREWSDLHRDADRQRHLRRIGFIPQDYGLLTDRSVTDLLSQDLRDSGAGPSDHRQRIEAALHEVALDGFEDRRVAALSGGQRQRVAIARMLARDVELVIADEPTANLDPTLTKETLALFRRLAERSPVLVITHDPAVATACDRTIVLQSAVTDAEPAVPPSSKGPRRRRRRTGLVAAIGVLALVGGISFAVVKAGSDNATPEQGASATASTSSTTSTRAGAVTITTNAQSSPPTASRAASTTTVPTTAPPAAASTSTVPPATMTPTTTAVSSGVNAELLPGVVANCDTSGGAGSTSTKPTSIVLTCADANLLFRGLSWTSWTASSATGEGQLSENDCTPDCADGTFQQYPASVTLTNVIGSVDGPVFSVVDASYPNGGPNGEARGTFGLPVAPPPTPTCTAAQLQGSVSTPGAVGSVAEAYVSLTNWSSEGCHMEGFPGFDLLDGSGTSIVNAGRGCGWAPAGTCPTTPGYVNLSAHGGTASFLLVWQTSPEPGQTCPESGSALVTPPNALDDLTLSLQIPVCGEPLELGVGTVQWNS